MSKSRSRTSDSQRQGLKTLGHSRPQQPDFAMVNIRHQHGPMIAGDQIQATRSYQCHAGNSKTHALYHDGPRSFLLMHCHRRLRSKEVVHTVEELLEDMALDARVFRGISYEPPSRSAYESTASSPSLRAAHPEIIHEPPPPTLTMGDQDSANVKVVVRVRKFLKRGAVKL